MLKASWERRERGASPSSRFKAPLARSRLPLRGLNAFGAFKVQGGSGVGPQNIILIQIDRPWKTPKTDLKRPFSTLKRGSWERNYKIQIPRLQITNKYKNFKFESRSTKFETNSNVQNSNVQNNCSVAPFELPFEISFFECYRMFHKSFCFEFLSFEFEDLFRISNFEFRA